MPLWEGNNICAKHYNTFYSWGKYMLIPGQRKQVPSFMDQGPGTCGPGRIRKGVLALGEEVSVKGYSPQDKDQTSRGTLTHRK